MDRVVNLLESRLESGKVGSKEIKTVHRFFKNGIQYGREKKEKLSSSVMLFGWEIMAVSKLPSNSMQKEADESSDVSDTGLECFTCDWLWSAHKFSQQLPS